MAEQSQTPTPQTDQSAPGASNRASRFASDTLSVLRRVPFTSIVVLTITVVGIATGACGITSVPTRGSTTSPTEFLPCRKASGGLSSRGGSSD